MKTHILYVHNKTFLGGAEWSIINLWKNIDQSKYRISAVLPPQGQFREEAEKMHIATSSIEFSGINNIVGLVKSVSALVSVIRRQHVDIIHSNTPQTNIPSAIAAILTCIPSVWHERNILMENEYDVDRMFARLPSRIVCNSQAIRNRFQGIRQYDEKTLVILNAADLKDFSPENFSKADARQKAGIPLQGFVIGTFDRLDPRKGHEQIIRAFAHIHSRFPKSFLIITGNAASENMQYEQMLRNLVRDLSVTDSVLFLGFRVDIPMLMAACDCVIQAARYEGCSRVICEAHCVGRPVIVSDNGGNPELVDDNVTGFIFPTGTTDLMIKHITSLITDPSLLDQLGNNARKKAEKIFSIQRYCKEMTDVYSKAVGVSK